MATPTAVDVVMPQMGVSVSEGTITKWLKQEGEEIQADESLLEISTDKVDTEVPSPGTGIVQQILVQEGETVAVGTRLAVIGAAGAEPAEELPPEPATQEAAAEANAAASSETPTPASESVQEPAPAAEEPEQPPEEQAAPAPAQAEVAALADGGANGKSFVSPVVARIASEHGVDVSQIQGTVRGGR
ncbi:MAG: E3 binding domain-containing protein, partial [Actinobacteria bacterium]|nr:E3 binding domain-containing protein [Actinomycetota bacterium]